MAIPQRCFPPKLRFGSLAIYPQRPHETELQRNAAAFIVRGVKRDAVTGTPPHRSYIQIAVDKLVELIPGSPLDGFFESAAVLIPMPGAALSKANTVSPTRSICMALLDAGLGARVVSCLRRTETIPKSAFAAPGERPGAIRHYDTLAVEMPLHEPDPTTILLVDDVVTRGATAMGAAGRLLERFPNASVKLFAIARTDVLDHAFYDPLVGAITMRPNGWYLKRHDTDVVFGGSGLPLF
jgi:hypothetical protein